MHTDRTSTTSTTRSRRRPSAVLGALAASASIAVALLGTASPASANEFEPQPAASFDFECAAEGGGTVGVVHATLDNSAGLATAHFSYTTTEGAPGTLDVATGQTSLLFFPVDTEDAAWTITVDADFGQVATQTFDVDCFGFQGEIALKCAGEQPVLTATVQGIGEHGDLITFQNLGSPFETEEVAADGTKAFEAEIPEGVAFVAELTSQVAGPFASLSGTPDCTPDPIPTTTSTSTTAPTPTTVAPTTSTTVPVVVSSGEATPPAPQVYPETLARTGSSTGVLVAVGVTLIGLGVALRRAALARRFTEPLTR